jgi:hypothetical protein
MRRALTALACLAVLQGCDALQPDKTALAGSGAGNAIAFRCDLCHGNPPNTGFHRYHVDTLGMKGNYTQGILSVTCISCHSASIAHAEGAGVIDSIFTDPADTLSASPVAYHTSGWPWRAIDRSQLVFSTVSDSLVDPPSGSFQAPAGESHPDWAVVASKGPGLPGHMSGGRADVVFQRGSDWIDRTYDQDGNQIDSVVHPATWNPVRMSCGMVACHNHHDPTNPASPYYDADTATYYTWNKPRRTGH